MGKILTQLFFTIFDKFGQGVTSEDAINVLNEAIKKSQEAAAKKLQGMTGGLSGMLGNMGQ